MSGFSNAVVGGVGKLVRKWIQSPDYAPAVSGWTVNQDGSAEFNDVTIRGFVVISGGSGELLVYAGTPAAGNLILAVSSVPGVDEFGNAYTTGLSIATTTPTDGNRSGITFEQPAYGISPYIKSLDQGVAVGAQLEIRGPNLDVHDAAAQIFLGWGPDHGGSTSMLEQADNISFTKQGSNTFGGIEFGAGPLGWYYNEMRDLAGVVIPNATVTQASGTLYDINSDYGAAGQFTGNVWTCPVTGYYDITMVTEFTSAAGSPARMAHLMQYTGVNSIYGPLLFQNDVQNTFIGNLVTSVSGVRLSMGDTLTPAFYQASTFSKTISHGYISIARRL